MQEKVQITYLLYFDQNKKLILLYLWKEIDRKHEFFKTVIYMYKLPEVAPFPCLFYGWVFVPKNFLKSKSDTQINTHTQVQVT